MPLRPRDERDPEALPDAVAARLLERASELDALRTADSIDIPVLRAAAGEAGISAHAFNAALAELHEGGQRGVPFAGGLRPRRWRAWMLAVASAVVVAAGALYVSLRSAQPSGVGGVPMVDEHYLVSCLPSVDAMELVRPHLLLPTDAVVVREGTRVLRISATPDQHQQIRATLEKHESAPACAAPTGAAPR